ncbi:MAG: cadherin-like beta sandwich domain-containing protein, partial [Lachnospiraceae bacterium]|nr:cadherin-like beta sandwich domain-containing protein [Lachnospiraceae bacterium]
SEMAIEFTIPVYLNMPEEICIAPEKALNPNNWLKSLKITDQNGNELPLTPTFDSSVKQSYSIIVDHEVSSAIVDAVTVSKLAEITSGSRFDLDVGENLITVKVKAENGKVRKYKIYISREPDPNAVPGDNTGDAENTGDITGTENNGETDNTGDPENAQTPEGTESAGEGDVNIPGDGTEPTDGTGTENGTEPTDGTGTENGGETGTENGTETGGEPEGGTGESTGEGSPEGGGE